MAGREKVIKELHDARRYLEDKEWSDRGASPHIDAINDAIALLKEQEPVCVKEDRINKCACGNIVNRYYHSKFCGYCGKELMWY